jgi:hypothetical protein
MKTVTENEEYASWLESRRLIIAQLAAMDGSIRELGARIDRYNDIARDRAAQLAKDAQDGLTDLRMRVAMLELRAKLWGGLLGVMGGAFATGMTQLIIASMRDR